MLCVALLKGVIFSLLPSCFSIENKKDFPNIDLMHSKVHTEVTLVLLFMIVCTLTQ